MKRFVLCLAALLLVPAVSMAQPIDGAANINMIMTPASYGGCADPQYDFIDQGSCTSLGGNQSPIAGQTFVWVVASREGGFPSIGGAQFGVSHSGVGGWTLCTGGSEIPQLPEWPSSGAGNIATWGGGCYTPAGTAARVGFFSVADGAAFSGDVIQDPRIAAALWIDCGAPPDIPPTEFEVCSQNLGGFGNLLCGDNCFVPTREASWGQIKALF